MLNKQTANQWLLSGEFDRHTLPSLWGELNHFSDGSRIEICLKGVNRIDSAGLAGLVRLKLNASDSGVSLSYINAPEQLLHLAEMSNVANMLTLN